MEVIEAIEDILDQITAYNAIDDMVARVWSETVVPVFAYLTIPNIRDWINGNVILFSNAGTHNTAFNIYLICNIGLYAWNLQVGNALSNKDQPSCVSTSVVICKTEVATINKRTRDDLKWSVTYLGQTYSGTSSPQPVSHDILGWILRNSRTC